MTLQEVVKNKEVIFIDVREPYEYVSLHVDHAINIPLGTIPDNLETFKSFDKPVILYCASGNRSNQAFNFLKAKCQCEIYDGGGIIDAMALNNLKLQNQEI